MADSLLLKALRRESLSRPPVWLMRQAGRSLPEYRALRKRAGSFLSLLKTPAFACEAALQPIERFGMDAAILFSDILTIPDAMGLGLEFIEGEGPRFANPLADESAAAALAIPPMENLRYVFDAVRQTKSALGETPLIGFSGAPFTLACYMIDGRGGEFLRARKMLYDRPDLMRRILDINAKAVADYLRMQLESGADALMIFESWAGALPPLAFRQFALPKIAQIVADVKSTANAPIIVFARGAGESLEEIAECGCDAVGVDWQTDLKKARRRIGGKVALQGNLDPAALLASAESVAAETKRVLSEGGDSGYIFNLGHGVLPSTPPENIAVLVEMAKAAKN